MPPVLSLFLFLLEGHLVPVVLLDKTGVELAHIISFLRGSVRLRVFSERVLHLEYLLLSIGKPLHQFSHLSVEVPDHLVFVLDHVFELVDGAVLLRLLR